MYIERKSDNSMDQEVNEATAALKGLLGIGSSSGSDTVIANPEEKETINKAEEEPDIVSPEQSKSKKKRNKKNKKKQDEQPDKSPPKPPKPQPQSEPSAQKLKNNNSTKKKKSKNVENFAWSAFQSSPDASKLPIPAFSSPVQSRKTLSAEQADNQLNSTSRAPVTGAAEAQQPDTPAANISAATASGDSTPTKEEASATGVNLAVLASNPPPPVTPNDGIQHPSSALGSPQGNSSAHHKRTITHRRIYIPSLPPMHQFQYLPPPPPGHVTIQVQVPPVLMPGRQMVVTSPAGYPVQIAVPEGYQAGMIIPVFVPAAPPMQHMLPHPSPPVMPPYSHPGGYYNPNVG